MKGRKALTRYEIAVKVLDLIELLGGGRKGILVLAEKCRVHEATIYRWSSYRYPRYPTKSNKASLLRLWYYYIQTHKGARNHAAQATTGQLNYEGGHG